MKENKNKVTDYIFSFRECTVNVETKLCIFRSCKLTSLNSGIV